MKKKALSFAAVAAAGLLTLSACGSGSAEPEGPTVEAGKLIHCMNAPYPPFEVAEGDGFAGFDIDLGEKLAEQMGLEYEALNISFESLESGIALDSNQCDIIIAGMAITEERASKMDFTEKYLNDSLAILTKAGAGITSEADLAGHAVGAQQGTTGEDLATDNGATVTQFEDAGLMIQAVSTGQVEAAIANVSIVADAVTSNEGLELAASLDTGEVVGAAVRKGNTELLTEWDTMMTALRESGEYDALVDEWFGEVADAARVTPEA
ncbi:ABC transporter substrate-binding protein [Brevibacterium samyangense]|uniref:Basic amino acid ABC transporter substrate-binding protein n=1 Tax=Brevibacterium samyangense TaxID=366888 RepID=A0ABP5F378_9MICO